MPPTSADEQAAQLAGVMVVVVKGFASPTTGVYLQDGMRDGVPCYRKAGGEETIHRGRDCKPGSADVVWWCGEHRSTANGDTVPTTGWELAPGREWGDDWVGEWVPDPELSVVLVAPVAPPAGSAAVTPLLVPLLALFCAVVYGGSSTSRLGAPFGLTPASLLDPGVLQARVLGFGWVDVLYLSHAALELVLGCIKLRGRYAHEPPGSRTPRSAMYVRHHAFSLLSSALLGWLGKRATGPTCYPPVWCMYPPGLVHAPPRTGACTPAQPPQGSTLSSSS